MSCFTNARRFARESIFSFLWHSAQPRPLPRIHIIANRFLGTRTRENFIWVQTVKGKQKNVPKKKIELTRFRFLGNGAGVHVAQIRATVYRSKLRGKPRKSAVELAFNERGRQKPGIGPTHSGRQDSKQSVCRVLNKLPHSRVVVKHEATVVPKRPAPSPDIPSRSTQVHDGPSNLAAVGFRKHNRPAPPPPQKNECTLHCALRTLSLPVRYSSGVTFFSGAGEAWAEVQQGPSRTI